MVLGNSIKFELLIIVILFRIHDLLYLHRMNAMISFIDP